MLRNALKAKNEKLKTQLQVLKIFNKDYYSQKIKEEIKDNANANLKILTKYEDNIFIKSLIADQYASMGDSKGIDLYYDILDTLPKLEGEQCLDFHPFRL